MHVLHGSDNVVFFLNLLDEFPLSRFDLSIHSSFGLLILMVDGSSLCTVNEPELLSNPLEQFISATAKLLNFFLLADICTLRFGQLFGSSGVDPLAYPVGFLDQLCSRRCTSVCGLGVVADYAGQVIALEDSGVDVIHDQIADGLIGIGIIW